MNIVKRFAAFAVALTMLIHPISSNAETMNGKASGVGMNIMGFTSVGFDGEPVDGSIFADSAVTVINLWQRWCGPCMIELPHFFALHEYYSSTEADDVQVVGALYYEQSHEIAEAVEYVLENGYNWRHMLICDELLAVANAAGGNGFTSIPQTFIVDRSGTVRAQIVGNVEGEALLALAAEWLEIISAEEAFILGDVDSSGSVNASDAILALRHAMGIIELAEAQIRCGDMDENGSIGVSDAVAILRLAMGL